MKKIFEKRVFKKRVGIVLCIVLAITLAGCGKNKDNQAPESKEYVWAKTEQTVKLSNSGAKHNNENWFELSLVKFEPLCKEDNIKSIEYYMENATGTFMDSNKDKPYLNEVTSTPYILNGSNQDGIYFSVYFNFDDKLEHAEEVKYVTDIFEKIRIKLTITFNDGSVKERNFALKSTSEYNYKNFDMYEITRAE